METRRKNNDENLNLASEFPLATAELCCLFLHYRKFERRLRLVLEIAGDYHRSPDVTAAPISMQMYANVIIRSPGFDLHAVSGVTMLLENNDNHLWWRHHTFERMV